jgi:fatty acid desaturase
MKKRIWITLILALVIINGLAELVTLYSGLFFPYILRVTLVLGIVMIVMVFTGAYQLISTIEEEKPLGGDAITTVGKATKKPVSHR